MKIVLATNNDDKIVEIRQLLADLPIQILSRKDFSSFPDPDETGTTLEENALVKARAVFRHTGLPSLADDSGLFVDALHGAPGVYSSRFAGTQATYEENCQKLLHVLDGVIDERRTAHFRCVIAIVWSAPEEVLVEGRCNGMIASKSVGESGFGYDPVFFYPPSGRCFSQLSLAEKNTVSHRGLALRQARDLFTARYPRTAADKRSYSSDIEK